MKVKPVDKGTDICGRRPRDVGHYSRWLALTQLLATLSTYSRAL